MPWKFRLHSALFPTWLHSALFPITSSVGISICSLIVISLVSQICSKIPTGLLSRNLLFHLRFLLYTFIQYMHSFFVYHFVWAFTWLKECQTNHLTEISINWFLSPNNTFYHHILCKPTNGIIAIVINYHKIYRQIDETSCSWTMIVY